MKYRVEVETACIDEAACDIRAMLDKRLLQHGSGSCIGPHETLGILTEEYDELIDAVRSNKEAQVEKELIDIAVGALFGVASLRANQREIKKHEAVGKLCQPKGPTP